MTSKRRFQHEAWDARPRYLTWVIVFTVSFMCSVSEAQIQVLHRSETSLEKGEGRILGTAVLDSKVFGLTEGGGGIKLFSLDTLTGDFASSSLPTETNQRLFPPDKAGPLATINGLIVGSFSPSNSDVFTVRADGSDFRVIADADTVGLQFPNVIAADGRVFGSTERGVFSLNPDGGELRIFPGEIESPSSTPLAFDGERIYGATWESFGFSPGDQIEGVGKIYSMRPDGSEFQTLRDIGIGSISSLTVQDGKIYGLEDVATGTKIGPDGPLPRYLFSMNTDGSDFQVLHQFQGSLDDGKNATRVVASGDKLFGVTRTGGAENAGTIFRSDVDGGNYEIIHNFGAGPFNGVFPNSDLVVIGSNLYGSTLEGGALDATQPLGGGGIVYSLPIDSNAVPEPTSLVVWLLFSAAACANQRWPFRFCHET